MFRMSDVDADDLPLVTKYSEFMRSNNLTAARDLLRDNPQLDSKIHNAAKFNKLIDAVLAMQYFFKDDIDGYISTLKTDLINYVDDFSYQGEYSPAVNYKLRNIVSYLGCTYICLQDNKGNTPTHEGNNAFWALIAKGIAGVSGTGLAPRGIWDNSTSYYKDDMVSYDNCFWQTLSDNINSVPSESNANWLLILDSKPKTGFTWGDIRGTI